MQRCLVQLAALRSDVMRNALARAGKTQRRVVSAFVGTAFPKENRTKLHFNNPIERLNGEIKRRTEVVGIFPNERAIISLAGAILPEENDERAVQRSRYMRVESVAQLSDGPLVSLPIGTP